MYKNNRSINLVLSGVMLTALIGKLLGFIKEIVLAYFFGAGNISDAYLISQTIPGTLFMVVGTGITTCFIPIYIKISNAEGTNQGKEFTNKFITIIACISLGMTLLVGLFPGFFVKIFAFGFDEEAFSLALNFTRVNSVSFIFSGFLYCLSALLQANNDYLHVSISTIPYNIGLIIAIIMGAFFNVYLLSIVSVLAVLFQLGYQVIFVKKIPYNYKISFHFNDSWLKRSLALFPPVVIGVAALEINTLIDRTIASAIITGGITIITYGTSLFNLITGLFSTSISAVYYPIISESVSNKDRNSIESAIQNAFSLVAFFLIPCTIGSIILKKEIVQLLFGHGYFNTILITELGEVFACYSIGIIPFALRQILNYVYYSNEKTNTPMINTIISVVVNIVLDIVLSRKMGLRGLAIASSISSFVVMLFLLYHCKRRLDT